MLIHWGEVLATTTFWVVLLNIRDKYYELWGAPTSPHTCQRWGKCQVMAQYVPPKSGMYNVCATLADWTTDSSARVQLVHDHLRTDPPGVYVCCATSSLVFRPRSPATSRTHKLWESQMFVGTRDTQVPILHAVVNWKFESKNCGWTPSQPRSTCTPLLNPLMPTVAIWVQL